MKSIVSLTVLSTILLAAAPALAGGDAAKGAEFFAGKCKACHSIEAGKNTMGPSLAGVMGRKVASSGFTKYQGLKAMDFVWDDAQMDKFLTDPKAFVGGGKTMVVKVAGAEDRANLIAYLNTLK